MVSCLVLAAAVASVKLTWDCDKLNKQNDSRVIYETYAVAGELIFVAVQTVLLQVAVVLLVKCAFFLLVEWVKLLFLILVSHVQLASKLPLLYVVKLHNSPCLRACDVQTCRISLCAASCWLATLLEPLGLVLLHISGQQKTVQPTTTYSELWEGLL